MTLMHIVLFRFKPDVTQELKNTFLREAKALKSLSCVKDERLFVGGPSLTNPIKYSKGFEHALISYHDDLTALEEYQVKKMEHWYAVTKTHDLPFDFDRDLCRFDFQIDPSNEKAHLPFLIGK